MGRRPALITMARRHRAFLRTMELEREARTRRALEVQKERDTLDARRTAEEQARKREEEEARAKQQLEHKQWQEQMEREREAWAIEAHKLEVYYHAVAVERERARRHRKTALDEFLEGALRGQ